MSTTIEDPTLPRRLARSSALSFRLLGPLEVVVNGAVTALHGQKQRTLLALLLLRIGEFVRTDWLIEELWVSNQPDCARASLQNFVSELRKVLGASALLSCATGYALDIEAEQLDLGRFRRIVAEARRATATSTRARRLRDALALWHGPALADIYKTPTIELEASVLDELRASALEDAFDAELELGSGAELVPELRRVIASEPYRERLRAQLMLALYRSGCPLRALEAFNEARETLRSDVGLEPSPRLRELQRAILNHEPFLSPRSAASL